MKRPKILWGVCGIGLGHTHRQMPLISHFAKTCDIVIFGYGNSRAFFAEHFAGHPHVRVEEVAVPYFVGNPRGLDFRATAAHPSNRQDYAAINARAMAQAEDALKCPNLVITDYEPVSAQYAYACNAPLMTLDQQSKYLCADVPERLADTGTLDEIMRLRMFFPRAEARLACSFFRLEQKAGAPEKVRLIPPILSPAILRLRHRPGSRRGILVYLSEQMRDAEERQRLFDLLGREDRYRFDVFLPAGIAGASTAPHVTVFRHGDPAFHGMLAACHGIVSTAGHSLLSEAMHLGIPVLALPLKLYEQQMNAHAIAGGGFGLSGGRLSVALLRRFVDNLPGYAEAIRADRNILLRGNGELEARKIIEKWL